MTQKFGGRLSETALGAHAVEAGHLPVALHASLEHTTPLRHHGADDEPEWETAWIDLGGEG